MKWMLILLVAACGSKADDSEQRKLAEDLLDREIARMSSQVSATTASLASPESPFVGTFVELAVK